jgi:cytoskeletal protein CcmA (bactofilin family)
VYAINYITTRRWRGVLKTNDAQFGVMQPYPSIRTVVPALCLVFFFAPFFSEAGSILRSGESVSLTSEQVAEGDFYVAANAVSLSGTVEGDAILVGGTVTVNGAVRDDLFIAGGTVDVHGAVGDDVRVAASEMTLAGEVSGNVVVVSRYFKTLSTARLGGDVVLFGGQVEILGEVDGNIVGRADSLRIDGPVAGNIDVTVGALTLGDRAAIGGAITYVSAEQLVRAQGATVSGAIVRNDPPLPRAGDAMRAMAMTMLVLLFATLSWFLVFRETLASVTETAAARPWRAAVVGFAFFFVIPIAAGVLFLSLLGSLVGILLVLAYLAALLAALLSLPALIGAWLWRAYAGERPLDILAVLIGATVVALLALIPLVGLFLLLAVFFIALGAVAETWYKAMR